MTVSAKGTGWVFVGGWGGYYFGAGHLHPSPRGSLGSPEEHQASFSPGPVDSPNSSMENPLDTTGDITVEEVKDFLA